MNDEDIILLQAIAKLIEWQMNAEEVFGALLDKEYGEISWKEHKKRNRNATQWRKYFDHITKKISELEKRKPSYVPLGELLKSVLVDPNERKDDKVAEHDSGEKSDCG